MADDPNWNSYYHRLHYRWSQLEADRCGLNIGSPARPLPKATRTLELAIDSEYEAWPEEGQDEQERFATCAGVYEAIDYNTFCKNGCLKLTEVELFFLSRYMTRATASEWLVVYLGVGNGERFRFLRDEFFPDLSVIAFDPVDEFYMGNREAIKKNAERFNKDGTNYMFYVRCFELDKDVPWILESVGSKKLLLISDVRGVYLHGDGRFDKEFDQELQAEALKRLRPISSLVKFTFPDPHQQFYDYLPGVVLKQTYTYYGSREVRLLIEGVPERTRQYNTWELYQKMMYHHDYLRGQVYESTRPPDCSSCIDHCFDCTVLWDTVSSYAKKNEVNPNDVLRKIIEHHVYIPKQKDWDGDYTTWQWKPPTAWQRYWDVEVSLRRGNLMEAIAILEVEGGEEDPEGRDWKKLANSIVTEQKDLSTRMRLGLYSPAKRMNLITLLGQLSDPFTLLRTELNSVGQTEPQAYWSQNAKHAAFIEASMKESSEDAGKVHEEVDTNGLPSPLVKRQKVNDADVENLDTNAVTKKVNGNGESTKAAKRGRKWHGVPCRHFMIGNCSFGANCGFLHAMVECPYFATNSCIHGASCSFLHSKRQDQPVEETKVVNEVVVDGETIAEPDQS